MQFLSVSPKLLVPLLAIASLLLALVVLGKVPLVYSVRNLLVRWRTTLLTALAFTLVVSLLVVMLAFVEGMAKLTENSGQPGNVLVLSDGATDELVSNLGFGDSDDVMRQPGVQIDEAGNLLASRETYLVVNQPTSPSAAGRSKRRFVQLRGIEDPVIAGRVHGLELYPGGQWFSAAGVQAAGNSGQGSVGSGQDGEENTNSQAGDSLTPSPVHPLTPLPTSSSQNSAPAQRQELIQAVIGEGFAREMARDLGREPLRVGDVFELGPRQWLVVGVMQSDGSTFGSEVWAKRDLVSRMFGKETLTTIVLRTADAAAAKKLADDLTENFKKSAIEAKPETEYFAKLGETNRQFTGAIIFVTVVMAVGGIFGVMNTMFAAVSARKRDIGVLRIIGFARWQVLAVFLVESLLLALVGGLFGCALGLLSDGWTANSIVSGGQGGGGKFVALRLVVDLQILAVGLLTAVLMGLFGGLIPAISAMRKRPLEALR